MNKKTVLSILLDLVFLVVFNLVFFLIGGTSHVASVWIAYGFIHFAYLMVVATPLLVPKSSSAAILGLSIYSISTAYFFAEFVLGVVFILVGSESYKASLIVQVIVAAVYAVALLVNLIANEQTAANVAAHESEVAYIKNTAAELEALVGRASDRKANKEIEKAYDIVHASPTKSCAAVKEIEALLYSSVSELRNAVKNDEPAEITEVARRIVELTEERNRKLKLHN